MNVCFFLHFLTRRGSNEGEMKDGWMDAEKKFGIKKIKEQE